MSIDILLPNGMQMQNLVDRPVTQDYQSDTWDAKLDPVVQKQTLVSSGAVELGDPLASRNSMIVRNLDSVRTARIGASGVSEKVGYLLEPKHELIITFDTSNAVSIYGIATGAELEVEVIES